MHNNSRSLSSNTDALQLAQRLINIGIALSTERDLERFFQLIVSEAKSLTAADAASLYLRRGNHLQFKVIQNSTKMDASDSSITFPNIPLPRELENCQNIVGYVVLSGQTLNIDNVYDISGDVPYTFNPAYDQATGYQTVSMVTVPMCNPSGEVMGALQLINHIGEDSQPCKFPVFETSLAEALASQAAVAYHNIELEDELRNAYNDTLCRLSAAAEYRDPETADHLTRMSHYSRIIAQEMGLSTHRQNLIFNASPMHDIGKIGIPDAILLKPGPLTDEERSQMQKHALIGEQILNGSDSELMNVSAVIAGSHHEKYDGSGYPRGLKGADIPIEGRIIALADVFDALVSKRVYKEAWSLDVVYEFMREQAGQHFDPEVVDAFFRGIDDILTIYQTYQPGSGFHNPKLEKNLSALHSS